MNARPVDWTWLDFALFIGAALPSAAVLMGAGLALAPAGRATQALGSQFIGFAVWLGALALILRFRHGRRFWESMAWTGPWRTVAVCLALGPVLAIAVGAVSTLLGQVEVRTTVRELVTSRGSAILVGFCAVTLGPLCEELLFRGFLQPLLAKSAGLAAIPLAALPFGILHGPNYSWSWRHVVLITLAGAAFGYARHRTGSTAASTALHSTYNLAFYLAFLISEGDTLY